MFKKTAAIILCAILAISFASCGKTRIATNAAGGSQPETTAAPETTDATDATDAADVPSEGGVMTHAEFVAAEVSTPVVVETFVQAKQIWWEGSGSIYTQAEDGAYFIYQLVCTEDEYEALVPGTKIRVSGTKAEWNGELEISDASVEILEGSYIAEAADATDVICGAEAVDHQNEFVSFREMTVVPSRDSEGGEVPFLYNWDGSGVRGDDIYFNVSVNGETFTFTVESDLCGADTEVYKAAETLAVGDVIDVEGFLYWYNGANPHVTQITHAK